jgi:hypothetical protein
VACGFYVHTLLRFSVSSYFVVVRIVAAATVMLGSIPLDTLPLWMFAQVRSFTSRHILVAVDDRCASQICCGLVTTTAFMFVYRHDISQVPVTQATCSAIIVTHQWLLSGQIATSATMVKMATILVLGEVSRRRLSS